MPLVTLHALAKTIQRTLNISEKEARKYAEIVMDMFGYDDCIIDNILDHADRRLFYRLESEGILNTRRDEALLSDGTNWRIRYWVFQKNVIFPSVSKKKVKNTRSKKKSIPAYKPQSVYSSLPETAWTTRKTTFI
jgi:transcription initiation factor IIE alpha subunit